MNIDELNEALEHNKNAYTAAPGNTLKLLHDAAKAYAKILPKLQELKEAREKATAGEYYNGSHRKDQATIKVRGGDKLKTENYLGCSDPTVCVLSANLIQSNEEKRATADFIVKAARIANELGDL